MIDNSPEIGRLSEQDWRHYRIRSKAQALRFINAVGFCYAFTPGPAHVPSLFEVLDTRSDDVRWTWAWDWKEALPTAKRAYYGRLLARKPTFVSMDLLPHFYALTGNVGQADDYLRLYAEGRLTALARRVYEVVARRGASTTRQIRAEVEPDRRGSSPRLLRAFAELQNLLLLARVGEVEGRGNYAYVWDVFERWLPDIVTRASPLSHRAAAARVLEQYVRIAGAPRPADAASLFGWSPLVIGTAIGDLRDVGKVEIARGPNGEERLVLPVGRRRRHGRRAMTPRPAPG
jgi:Winged helix DNA-binding domain